MAETKSPTGTATVSVACKLPNGFIMELIESSAMLQPAVRGRTVIIAGANSLRVGNLHPMVLPYAITEVDEAFARKWFEANKDLTFVRNGAVFIQDNAAKAAAKAKEQAQVTTGLEPLNPGKPPEGIEADKDQLRRLKAG
ncbi:MAG: hypothetical protein ACRD3Q_00360 [Terriglobales bacterium]